MLERESYFAGTNDRGPWSSFMFPNGRNIKWTQVQSKHGICPKLGSLGKYFQFILMNKSITNWNYIFLGIKPRTYLAIHINFQPKLFLFKGLIFQKKKKKIIMNKSSSFLVHLHLLHFVIIKKKILHFQKENSSFFNGKISKTIFQRKNLQWTNLQ